MNPASNLYWEIKERIECKSYTSLRELLDSHTDEEVRQAIKDITHRSYILLDIRDLDLFERIIGYLDPKSISELAKATLNDNKYDHLLILSDRLRSNDAMKISEVTDDPRKAYPLMIRALSKGKQLVNILTSEDVHDSMLSFGIVPYSQEDSIVIEEVLPAYLDGIPDDTFAFWHGKSISAILKKVRLWSMFTEAWGKKNAHTSLLRVLYPHLLYSSNRLKTDMSLYRLPRAYTGKVINSDIIREDGRQYPIYYPLNGEYEINDVAFPVIRYSKSAKTGLYHGAIPKVPMCGTFFYLEPESTIFLTGGRVLIAETKCRASRYLAQALNDDELMQAIDSYMIKDLNARWDLGEMHPDMLYTPSEAAIDDVLQNYIDTSVANTVTQHPIYIGKLYNIGLYAAEDLFDQPLCKAASKAGFDLVVLTRMIGSYQVVTEVLDTRDRQECFANLVFTA